MYDIMYDIEYDVDFSYHMTFINVEISMISWFDHDIICNIISTGMTTVRQPVPKASKNDRMGGTCVVCRLHCLVNEN